MLIFSYRNGLLQNYRFVSESVTMSFDYDLITAGLTDTEDYGSLS